MCEYILCSVSLLHPQKDAAPDISQLCLPWTSMATGLPKTMPYQGSEDSCEHIHGCVCQHDRVAM